MTQTNLAPRKREGSGPRVSMYTSWSYPAETGRELYELNNRYSAMWEVRRVAYPRYEEMAGNPQTFRQGIDGTLELFHRDWEPFRETVSELSGHPVPYFERIDSRRTQIYDRRPNARRRRYTALAKPRPSTHQSITHTGGN